MNSFTKNLKRFRLSRNMTQEQAAQALGVSTQSVSRWECGTTLPDVTILPQIARLYGVTIDDLYKENSTAYDNYAQRLGSVFEASRKPEDFLQADIEYRKLFRSGQYSTEDLRLYAILYQQMMGVCMKKAEEIFDRALRNGPEDDPQVYWAVKRQKNYFRWQIGRNGENIQEFLPLVEAGSHELQVWICLIQSYIFAKEFDTALAWAQKAEAKFPESTSLHIYMGDLFRAMKRYDQAFLHWRRAMELEPQWCDAAYSMAACYEELGEYEKAAQMYSQIADDLDRRGFEAEILWPREKAQQCLEKAGQ